MDLTKLATNMLMSKLGGSANNNLVQSALGSLLGGGSSDNKGIDLGSLIGKLKSSGLSNLTDSWLGDGANEEISESQLESVLGADKVQEVASQLGTQSSDVLSSLKDMLPQLIDKASPDGSLLDSLGDLTSLVGSNKLGGLASLASKFLK